MPKTTKTKKRITITVDADILDWIDANVTGNRFASRSHALEYGASILKLQSDGVGTEKRWWEWAQPNEEGTTCDPIITSVEDVVKLLHPIYPPVEKPTELDGWSRVPGYEHDHGYKFIHVYRRIVGRIALEIATDISQNIVKVSVFAVDANDIVEPYPREQALYNLRNKNWPSTQELPIGRVYTLDGLAAGVVRHAEELNQLAAVAGASEKRVTSQVE